MATFPAIEPLTRSYDFGEFPMAEETAWSSGRVRYLTGSEPLMVSGLLLTLEYTELTQAEALQILDHYAFQQGGSVDFLLPDVIWLGHTTDITPSGTRWRYAERPEKNERRTGLVDMTVTLEAMAYTSDVGTVVITIAPPAAAVSIASIAPRIITFVPIAATYSQSSVYVDNTAATAENMTNGVFAETTQTGTNNSGLQWVQMDFGAVTSFSSIIVGSDYDNTLAGGWGKIYSENLDVQTSNDGTSWTTIGSTGTFSAGLKTLSLSGSARYIRLSKTSAYIALTEFYALA
jgi:hypothetical protein